jgi:hypothetical protein
MKKRYHSPIMVAALTAIALIVTVAAMAPAMADENPLASEYMEAGQGGTSCLAKQSPLKKRCWKR